MSNEHKLVAILIYFVYKYYKNLKNEIKFGSRVSFINIAKKHKNKQLRAKMIISICFARIFSQNGNGSPALIEMVVAHGV